MGLGHSPRIVTDGMVLYLDAANPKNYNLTEVEVLVVAGGGGGGMDMGGGGGGGGVIYSSSVSVTPGSAVSVTVGNGGAGAPAAGTNGQPGGHQYTIAASNGGNSVFGALTAIGGGFGGSSFYGYTPGPVGGNGGSGGGASGYSNGDTRNGGTGTAGQGFAGGRGGGPYYSGGGGGAGGAGTDSPNQPDGGPGVIYPTMSPYYFGGGGGGASYSLSTGGNGGIGGGGGGAVGATSGGAGLNNGSAGGGGSPNSQTNTPGGNAGANTGGGGGGGSHYNANNKGGEGGSGIVIVRYQGPQKAIGGTITSNNGYTIHTFTTVGSTTFTPLVATNNSAILGLSDLSGRGNFGTTANSPTYSSANGGSIVFDGTDDRVIIPTISLGNGNLPWTCTAWVKTSTSVNSLGYGSVLSNSSSGPVYSMMGVNNGKIVYWTYQNSAWAQKLGIGKTINDNNWHFLSWVNYLNYTMDMYVDGSLDSNVANSTSGNNNPINIIGASWAAAFSANIAQVSVYNRALSAAEIQQNYNALAPRFAVPPIVTDGLVLNLDAGNSASYPGSGTTWTDLSGNGYNFNVNASAYSTTGGIPHMNFEGSFGAAKRGGLTDVPNFSNATIMCFSTILNSTGNWRTLIRASSTGQDHQVIIQAGANNLGMYDNNAVGFISSGFDITSLPNPYTQFNCLTWRMSQSSPYYQFQYNNNPTTYTITNANSTYTHGFSVIGAYHNESTGTGSGDSSQYWGKISVFLYYNRHLTEAEIQQNYNALRGRFGI